MTALEMDAVPLDRRHFALLTQVHRASGWKTVHDAVKDLLVRGTV